MSDRLDETRRLSFGQVAELYERARPSYPAQLVDDVLAYAAMRDGEEIVDVGAGTGKATRLFAERGHRIVAIEPSAEMAAVARRMLAGYANVEIAETEFESWKPPRRFGLLISGQAWHWTDPETRYAKARAALRSGGALAVFWNWPDWRHCPLRDQLDLLYAELASEIPRGDPMRPATDPADLEDDWEVEVEQVDGFGDAETRYYQRPDRYTSSEYVGLLSTTSGHVVLADRPRRALLDRITAVIDDHGGTLELPTLTRLCLARAI